MPKEEELLREYACHVAMPVSNDDRVGKELRRLITALVKAVREDCIEAYHDWEDRPGGHTNVVTFPEAIRKNMRWHKITIRRK